MTLNKAISRRKKALKGCNPKRRDKLRHELRVVLVAAQIKRECRAS
jgi:hypothetical protein